MLFLGTDSGLSAKQAPTICRWSGLSEESAWEQEEIEMSDPQPSNRTTHQFIPTDDLRLQFLTPEQLLRIDQLLASVGDYGEVHLIVQRGELRYINRVESFKAWGEDARR